MPPPHEPVSLIAAIVAAAIGLAICLPIFVKLVRERTFLKARDASWDEATSIQQEQLKAIYAIRGDLETQLREAAQIDFQSVETTLSRFDLLIDASWNLRHVGGLERGVEQSRRVMIEASSVETEAQLAELVDFIEQSVRALNSTDQEK